jgi:hypothetical protein
VVWCCEASEGVVVVLAAAALCLPLDLQPMPVAVAGTCHSIHHMWPKLWGMQCCA